MTTVAILFWAGVFLVFYTYLGYGILLWLLGKIREAVHPARRYAFPADPPAVTLLIAADILDNSPYEKMLAERYASYDSGEGRLFEEGKLTLEQVADYARRHEPVQRSGKQELF